MKKTLSYIVILSSLFVIGFIIADFIVSNKVKKDLAKSPQYPTLALTLMYLLEA